MKNNQKHCEQCGVAIEKRFRFCAKCMSDRQYGCSITWRVNNPNYNREHYAKYGRKRYLQKKEARNASINRQTKETLG